MFIFKRSQAPPLGAGARPCIAVEVAQHGFITGELFVIWLHHFIDYGKLYFEQKVILLLDGYITNTQFKSIEISNIQWRYCDPAARTQKT